MKDLIINVLPMLIATVFVGVAASLCPKVIIILKKLDSKAEQIIGSNNLDQAKNAAVIILKALIQKYPGEDIEKLIAETITKLESQLGSNIFTEKEIEGIVRATVADIEKELPSLFNNQVAKQNVQLNTNITQLTADKTSLQNQVTTLQSKLNAVQSTLSNVQVQKNITNLTNTVPTQK